MKTKRTAIVLVMTLGLVVGRNALAYYNPNTGRWLNRDPIEEKGGAQLYCFIWNAPGSGCDSGGMRPLKIPPASGSISTTDVDVGIEPADPCPGTVIRVVFSFTNGDASITRPGIVSESAEFLCDGTPTGISDFRLLDAGEGATWNVVCRSAVKSCADLNSGNTRLAVSGRSTPGAPLAPVAEVGASWSYQCACNCKLKGKVHIGKSLFVYSLNPGM